MSDLNTTPPRPVAAKPDTLTPKFMMAVIAGVVVCGIYFGRPVLLPLALAVLTSFALAPLVTVFKKLRLGNVGSVTISLFLAVMIVSSLGLFMGSQLAKLAADLPHYQTNLAVKIHSVVGTATHNDTISRLNKTVENLAEQITGGAKSDDNDGQTNAVKPIPVVVTRESLA